MTQKSGWVLLLTLIFAGITGYVNLNASEVQAPMACLLLFSCFAGCLQPRGAWRWALMIGLSIMVSTFVGYAINYPMIDPPHLPITLVVLVIPALIAAYIGVVIHHALTALRFPPHLMTR